MLRFHNYDIVFREVPGEVTLAVNITGCPNRCLNCHSPHLQEDTGVLLDEAALGGLLAEYGDAVTCVCFMGGDVAPEEVERLAVFVKKITSGRIKCAWYSGKAVLPAGLLPANFDYIKTGAYVEELGGLDSPRTNQRFFRVENGEMIEMSRGFR